MFPNLSVTELLLVATSVSLVVIWCRRSSNSLFLKLLPCPVCFLAIARIVARLIGSDLQPDASFIWGHEAIIWRETAHKPFFRWTTLLGPVYRIKSALFQEDILVLGDHTGASHVLQNAYDYEKAPAFVVIVERMIGRGLVWATGEEHKIQRRLVSPAFTLKAVRNMQDSVMNCSEEASIITCLILIEKIKGLLHGAQETVINMEHEITLCALQIFGEVGMGHDFRGDPTAEAILTSFNRDVEFGRTWFGFLAPILVAAFPWVLDLQICKTYTDSLSKRHTVKISQEVLNGHGTSTEASDPSGLNILSILAQEKAKGRGAGLNEARILANWKTNIILQAKLRAELNTGHGLAADEIVNLPYLEAVVKEGLRLHPIGPPPLRIAGKDDMVPLSKPVKLSNGSHVSVLPVKRGQVWIMPASYEDQNTDVLSHWQLVHIPIAVLNADVGVSGDDALEFKPERFLMIDGKTPADDFSHGPFGNNLTFLEGPRLCIGWRLAVLELKIMLALLVQNFAFQPTEDEIKTYLSAIVMPFCKPKQNETMSVQLPLQIRLASEADD
ncbi:cytochrome P450 [Fistulina hepatica ATCC 64428]|uniref:Cytochrome P450 n=1 Tax=Fistulina hepatica ATCC 64428 TaxID=1128425 RepID=A0A0D7A214_9AGAR|nr:cytochrome P450 [Fistulina hepatica ATCC 64428]